MKGEKSNLFNAMSKESENLLVFVKSTLIPLAGVILAILNIWLASKLSPITQDLAVLRTTVRANAANIENVEELLEKRLDRLESKLDDALEYIYTR